MQYYHVVCEYINFNEMLWNNEFIILSLKIGPFYENFILQKFGAIW